MSSALVSRLLAVLLLACGLVCTRMAVANAASVADLLAGGLTASAAPGLLGPITSVGRKGWDCKPEHAAAAQHWRTAELPPDPAAAH
jgi:hypothetical protein